MMPSMFAGVSGLRNHQIRLNVIGTIWPTLILLVTNTGVSFLVI